MQKVWESVLAKLEKQVNRPSFNTWLRPTHCVSVDQQMVCIGVPDEVFVYWLGEYYVYVITETLTEILGFQPAISFVVTSAEQHTAPSPTPSNTGDLRNSPVPAPSLQEREIRATTSDPPPLVGRGNEQIAVSNSEQEQRMPFSLQSTVRETLPGDPCSKNGQELCFQAKELLAKIGSPVKKVAVTPPAAPVISPKAPQPRGVQSLNSSYTFESFVVGSGNRFAHAAALAVANQMATNYNPLFIYGGVGLGKTHLLHAIGHYLVASYPRTRILYLPSEQFVNDMVASIRGDRMAAFRDKYRNIDLLLVDDIQFIARKERTQEEFFHTFNTLYQARKQIVLTSDCPPKKIPTIAEQLRSRFECGLIADIQAPDLETRIAILKKKAEVHQIDLSDEVAIYIATKVKSNIRELEGCLSKIKAYSALNQHAITIELVQRGLRDLFDTTPKKVTIALVQEVVANHYHIEPASMRSSSRSRRVTFPRQIAMYLARELTNFSLPDIGRNFGGRNHSTVMHACKKIEKNQAHDQKLKQNIMQIRELIKA